VWWRATTAARRACTGGALVVVGRGHFELLVAACGGDGLVSVSLGIWQLLLWQYKVLGAWW
jgi:hypothetical protein